MLALSQDLSQNRPAEAKGNTCAASTSFFFTLSPEKSAIEHNVKRAAAGGQKRVQLLRRLCGEGISTNRIIAGNINQVLQVDSVVCNFDRYPPTRRGHTQGR